MPREFTIQYYLEKAAAYCAYQERSEQDVTVKLSKWDLKDTEKQEILEKLRSDKFFDDQRFAEAYVRGKHRQNKWGRFKILQGLSTHGISSEVANTAMETLSRDEYIQTLDIVLNRKVRMQEIGTWKEKARVMNYLQSRGFEIDLIQDAWNRMELNHES